MTHDGTNANTQSIGTGAPVLAFDVGGTTIKGAYVDESGTPRDVIRFPTPPRGADCAVEVIDAAATLSRHLGRERPVASVGLALPGIFDDDAGVGVYSENLNWRNVDFRSLVADRFEQPVALLHDVRAAGLAEMAIGAGQGAGTAVVVAIGTGVAGAVFVEGHPRIGGGMAGEIGHAVVVPQGETCLCGNQGCLEAIASAAAIVRRYERASGNKVAGAKEVLEAVASGDTAAILVWESALDALARSLTHIIALIAPEVIIIGGGLSEAGDALLIPLGDRLGLAWRLSSPPPLKRATAGENAGLLGAALAARGAIA